MSRLSNGLGGGGFSYYHPWTAISEVMEHAMNTLMDGSDYNSKHSYTLRLTCTLRNKSWHHLFVHGVRLLPHPIFLLHPSDLRWIGGRLK